ncbi:MAG: MMPL family transporter [Spirochaetia bacterium]|nr:MMPL family transporter [Spirochaetia bacterium]
MPLILDDRKMKQAIGFPGGYNVIRLIRFSVDNPIRMIVIIAVISAIQVFGLTRLHFDSSTGVIMPKGDPLYQMGERAKYEFGDNQSFMLAAIEADSGEIISLPVLEKIQTISNELDELRNFNSKLEDSRLTTILNLSGAKVTESKEEIAPLPIKPIGPDELWDPNVRLEEHSFRQPIRQKRKYDLSEYKPLSLAELSASLDPIAQSQLQTILRWKKIDAVDMNRKLEKKEFGRFLDAWEEVYLMKSVEAIRLMYDPVTAEEISGNDGKLGLKGILPEDGNGKAILPKDDRARKAYIASLKRNPVMESLVYSLGKDKNIQALGIVLLLEPQKNYEPITDYLWEFFNRHDVKPVKILLMGPLIFTKIMNESNRADLRKYMPIALLFIIIVLYFNFRTVLGVALPFLTIILGTLWTLGFMGFAGVRFNIFTSIMPPIMIAVGSSYAIHVLNHYLSSGGAAQGKAGIIESLSEITSTVFLAASTTFLGFATLLINYVDGLRDFGFGAAFGVIAAGVLACTLIPAVLALLPEGKRSTRRVEGFKGANIWLRRFIDYLAHLSTAFAKPVVLVWILVMVMSGVGISRMTTETSATSYFDEGHYIRRAVKKIGLLFNGFLVINVVVDSGKPYGVTDPAFLKYIEDFRSWAKDKDRRDNDNILHTMSFSEHVKRMHQAFNDEKPAFYRVPEDPTTVADYVELFSGEDENSDGRPDVLEGMVDREYRRVNVLVRIGENEFRSMSNAMSRNAWHKIEGYFKEAPNPNGYKVLVVGEPINFVLLGDYVVKGQIATLVLTTLLLGLIVLYEFRNIKVALVSLIPITVTVTVVFGVMGFTGIPLDIAKAILTSIALGIGIDDTCHYLLTYKRERESTGSATEAVKATHSLAGIAIIYTSIALIFGFSVLMFSSFTPIFHFGLLIAVVMTVSTCAALTILPAVLRWANFDMNPQFKFPWDRS